jgi:hypothetical protein
MNLTAGGFQRWASKGDILYIPYASTSGSTGSSKNYGTYLINSVSGFSVSVTAINTAVLSGNEIQLSATESLTIGGIKILQHSYNNDNTLDIEDVKLGYNLKMQSPYFAFMDDATNGRI